MATKNLGKVFMTPKGRWDKTLSYAKLDIVTVKEDTKSSGYIASTDIEANVTLADSRWIKLFELVDGGATDEYKELQKDVTNKSNQVNTNKQAIDLIYEQIQKIYDVEISTSTPTNDRTGLWINPDKESTVSIPELKDNVVNTTDTWSSQKIYDELQKVLIQINALQSKMMPIN